MAYLLRVAGEDVAVVVGEWVAWPRPTKSSKARVGESGIDVKETPGMCESFPRLE